MKELILSLFPGADLFGRAFEERGACVVRGPELLLGQHIEDFHVPPDVFSGVIGGPPCQKWSPASRVSGTRAQDLIPEFVRLVEEARPQWVVMENVPAAGESEAVPAEWAPLRLKDWACGGETRRSRTFWFWPPEIAFSFRDPRGRPGRPAYTLLASDGRRSKKGAIMGGHPGVSTADAAELQGFPELAEDWPPGGRVARHLAVYYLGNGVPRAMGLWVADTIIRWREGAELTGATTSPDGRGKGRTL